MSNFDEILESLSDDEREEILKRKDEIFESAFLTEIEKLRREGTPARKQLTEEYKSAMYAARGNGSRLRELREKYRQLGVDVDSVVFS